MVLWGPGKESSCKLYACMVVPNLLELAGRPVSSPMGSLSAHVPNHHLKACRLLIATEERALALGSKNPILMEASSCLASDATLKTAVAASLPRLLRLLRRHAKSQTASSTQCILAHLQHSQLSVTELPLDNSQDHLCAQQ